MIYDNKGNKATKEQIGNIINPGPAMMLSGFGMSGAFMNPDEIGVAKYKTILKTDETFGYGYELLVLAVSARLGEYHHENQKINDFVNLQFEQMRPSMKELVEGILSAIWAGFSLCEMAWVRGDDGKINLFDVQPIDPEYVSFHLHTDGIMKNRVKEVELIGTFNTGLRNISIDKFLLYTHGMQFMNPYGVSRFQRLYPIWYIKKNLLNLWPKALEKYAMPLALWAMKDPNGQITDPSTGETITNMQYAIRMLSNMQGGTGVAYNGDDTITVEKVAQRLGQDYKEAIDDYCNKMIFRGMFIPSLIADKSGASGNFAMSQTHFDVFVWELDSLRNDVVEVILEQLIRRMIVWNFGEQDDYGEFSRKEFDANTAKILVDIYMQATNAGYLDNQRYEDNQHVRQNLDLPDMTKEEHAKAVEEKKKIAEEIAGKNPPQDEEDEKTNPTKNTEQEKMKRLLQGVSTMKV